MKTSNVKKILSIVIVSLVVAVTLTTIILAVVPKALYNPIKDGYNNITIWKDGVSNVYLVESSSASEEGKKVDKQIEKLQKNSVRDNQLSSIFQGTGKYEVKVVSTDQQNNVLTSVANKSGVVCLVFDYLDTQVLQINGEDYINSKATTTDKTVKYRKIYMPISSSVEFEECTVYLADSDNKSTYQVKFLACQADLYEYLTSLTWDMV